MPGRSGPRFALEAGFLILLAVAAGLADLRPAVIVLIMAVAWILVALVELMSDRIASVPRPFRASYWSEHEEPQPAEEAVEHGPEPEPEAATTMVVGPEVPEPARKRRWFRRKGREEEEDLTAAPTPQPRHVRLLPSRRQETSQAAAEVADIFDDEERDKQAR